MDVAYVRLIGQKREGLWTGCKDFSKLYTQAGSAPGLSGRGPLDHLAYIKERHGEKIVAVDSAAGAILGWIGLYPDRDEGGLFFHLAGIEVHADHRRQGIGAGLLEEAGKHLQKHKTARLRFGTSPLLTQCAALFVTRFGTRYRWKEGVRTADGRPWPYVTCECDFDDTLFKPLDLRDDEVGRKNVLQWDGLVPSPRKGVIYSGPLAVILPPFSTLELAEAVGGVPGFLETIHDVFHELHHHGYGFAWFDRTQVDGAPVFYYVMKKVVTF